MKRFHFTFHLGFLTLFFLPWLSCGVGIQRITSIPEENQKVLQNTIPSQPSVQKVLKTYRTLKKVEAALPLNPILQPIQKKVEKWAVQQVQKQTNRRDFFLDKKTTTIILLLLVLIFVLAVAAGRDVLGAFRDILMIVLILLIIFLLLKLLEVI
jgi:hypothetical protein